MAESILQVPHTLPAESLSESFFSKSPTDLRFKNTKYDIIYPRNSIANTNTILFELPVPTGPSVYLLDKVLISVEMKILSKDGEKIPNDSEAAPINLPLTSFISHLNLELNDTSITPQAANYNYKNMIDTILNYNTFVKTELLQIGGFYEDTEKHMDALDSTNIGYTKRRDLFSAKSGTTRVYKTDAVHFLGDLNLDFTSPSKPILNGVKIKISLTLANNDFVLKTTSSKDLVYKISSCNLLVPIANITDDLYSDIIRDLKKEGKAFYNYLRRELININIAAGQLSYTTDTLFTGGKLPSKLILGFVKTSAYQGSKKLNPYNFLREDKTDSRSIKKVTITLNGTQIDGLELPVSNQTTLDYYRLHLMTGLTKVPFTNGINFEKFKSG